MRLLLIWIVRRNYYPTQKEEDWAFDSGELELEPLAQKSEFAQNQIDSQGDRQSILDTKLHSEFDDTTVAEPMPTEAEMGSFYAGEDDLTVRSDRDSEFDHDATLPSERAIQSSLQDYFDTSQSTITMEQNRADAADSDVTEHSISSTSPLDTSATHVTAHTIFTAGQARQASTGLAKYAIFGTSLLVTGLGVGCSLLFLCDAEGD